MFPSPARKKKSIYKAIQRSTRSWICCTAIAAIAVSLVLALLLFVRFRRHELSVRHQHSTNEALRKRYIALAQTHNQNQMQRALSIVPPHSLSSSSSSSLSHSPSPPLSSRMAAMKKRKFIPIVVYVHNRPHYFRQIVDALRNVTGIQDSLLIVSHDGIFDEMNKIVESIDFVNVIQLLHPYYNARPEERGLSKLRRHWWWLMEQVYDTMKLDQGRYRFDHVLFIEEDHLVSPDILDSLQHMLHIVENERLPAVPGYHENKSYIHPRDIIGVAMYNHHSDHNAKVSSTTSISFERGLINTGYCWRRDIWKRISSTQGRKIYDGCRNGWDVMVQIMMHDGLLPQIIVKPSLSRIKNIGAVGINLEHNTYDKLNFGTVHTSSEPRYRWEGNWRVDTTSRINDILPNIWHLCAQ